MDSRIENLIIGRVNAQHGTPEFNRAIIKVVNQLVAEGKLILGKNDQGDPTVRLPKQEK